MKTTIHVYVFISLLLLGAPFLLAQQESGQIYGTITDATTGEALYGANVSLKGTSLGCPSDINGQYTIHSIPSGSYTLKVSYIGYQGKEISVEVISGSKLEQNFSLKAQAIEGAEVVVTAQARGQKSAINQQLSSNTISNIVSAERIHELPDASAAAALSRLPGVSIMNGDQVVIRGIQAKLNTVLINGIQLPSTDMTNRSTNLGFISSNMLSGIEVIKTLTPDMDANTIGGVVNLKLREAPSEFKFDIFVQGNYNNQDHTTDNYKTWVSVSDRFFGDKLGVFIQGNADRSNGGQDRANASYGGVHAYNDDWFYGQMTGFSFADDVNINSSNGASVILDYLLPHGKIVFQNTYAHTLNDNMTLANQLAFNPNTLTYSAIRDKYGKDLFINAIQAEYMIGDVKAEMTLSHSFTNKYTYLRYGDPGDNFGFANTGYDPFFNKVFNTALLTPDDVYHIQINPADIDSAYVSGWLMTRNESFNQHLYNASADFTIPVSFSTDVTAKFKVGGKFYRTTRSNDLNVMYLSPNLTPELKSTIGFKVMMDHNYYDQRGKYFLDGKYDFRYALDRDKTDSFLTNFMNSWPKDIHWAKSLQDDFAGAESFSAEYVMGTFNIGSRLTIIGGGRFEHYNMNFKANFDYVTHSVNGDAILFDTLNTVNRNEDNFFPNVQIRYKFTNWLDLRLAYSNGISRPDYRAIVPSTYFEPGGAANAGNPNLKPALSTNYDVALSVYSDEIGLFTISPFYKKINDLFYFTSIYYKNLSSFNVAFPDSALFISEGAQAPAASQTIGSYVNNSNPGYVSGVELDWQTNFWYLPKPLNALVLNINYTKSWSDMAYSQVRNSAVSYKDTTGPRPVYKYRYVSTDTVYHARLLWQANDVVNVALGIDYKDFSGRISFNFQGNVITSLSSTASREGDQFTGNIYRWDFTLQQKLPVPGLSIMLSGVNIFHNPVYTYQNFKKYGSSVPTENLASTSYSPSIFELTLRYSM